jgi:hypothetical protein
LKRKLPYTVLECPLAECLYVTVGVGKSSIARKLLTKHREFHHHPCMTGQQTPAPHIGVNSHLNTIGETPEIPSMDLLRVDLSSSPLRLTCSPG